MPRWTATEAERALLRAGFEHLRSKGSHRIYGKGDLRVVVPFHGTATLHPKIVKQVVEAIDEGARDSHD
ncbi:MAG TPA: type II toxin-antitoxin system HicA family toxin [Bryobacteraceae bacterium]|nr:type II toxin-antitoxin system HicA family toxin [Bryobacteraceae bacterium]